MSLTGLFATTVKLLTGFTGTRGHGGGGKDPNDPQPHVTYD